MPVTVIDDEPMPSEMDDFMPSQTDEQMPSQADEVMPSIQAEQDAKLAALNASIDPTAFAEGGVNQPSQYGSGYTEDGPNLLNEDDWGLTAALAGPSGPPALAGKALNFAGQALKGDLESMLFSAVGDKQDANQQLTAAAEKMMPSMAAKDRALGIPGTDPYEEASAMLPPWERMASEVGPELVQTAPQIALTAMQPEIGAFSFGLAPQGFDPVQATTMLIAPGGGKLVGGIVEKLAAKAGISNAQALDAINRLGGGAGVASLISAPTVYKIAQMQPGPERDGAIQDAVSNAILTGHMGSIGPRDEIDRPNIETEGAPENAVPVMGPPRSPDVDSVIQNVFPAEDPDLGDEEAGTPQILGPAAAASDALASGAVVKPFSQNLDIPAMPAVSNPKSSSANQIPTIRGRRPINSRYAGQAHPSGVKFTSQGFPDFSPYAIKQVKVEGLTGEYKTDEKMANKSAGLEATPDGYVWHHVHDGKTMQLIPKDIHRATRHTGGAAIIRNGGFDENYINGRKISATGGRPKTGGGNRLPDIRRLSTLHQ